jgi:hypothetical protein
MKADSLLLRQVHPNFYIGGQLSSQAFFPFPKDKWKLSVYDGELVSPAQSFVHYTQNQILESVGVWGVSNIEVTEIGLTSEPDPLPDSPAHALIDFNNAPDKECRKLAKKLKAFAVAHGCLYSPE